MKSFAKYKKAIAGMMAMTLIGLIIVAIAIATSWIGMDKVIKGLIMLIMSKPSEPRFLASPANFDRLNDEIDELLENEEPFSYNIIPYTLGIRYKFQTDTPETRILCDISPSTCQIIVEEPYVLVGFNGDKVSNDCILNQDPSLIAPSKCNNTGKACLCLCIGGKGCEEGNCKVYEGIDYFITTNKGLQSDNMIEGIHDPITGGEAYCLILHGSNVNKGLATNIWKSRNLYIEKAKKSDEDSGVIKTYIFVEVADEDTEKRTKSCINYEYEYECALGHDGSGHNCVPYYDRIGRYSKCDVCPTTCTLDDYEKGWLIVFDPCECAPEVEQEEMCLDYKEEYECALGSTEERGCVPEYKQGVFDMCVPCSPTCSLEEYPNYWLRGLDNCGCVNQMQPKAGCSLYDDEYECAAGKDFGDNKCLPKYDVLRRFSECINCPKDCKLDIYSNEWLKALDPCGCAESYAAE